MRVVERLRKEIDADMVRWESALTEVSKLEASISEEGV
jgi:hypothetical protein